MSAEENKALVERFVEEFWNEGNLSTADELFAPGAEIHMPTGEVVGLDGLKGFAGVWRGSFPDWHSTFEELVAEGDTVAGRWTGGARTGGRCRASLPPAHTSRCRAASSTGSSAGRSWSSGPSST